MKITRQVVKEINESSENWKSFAPDKYANWLASAIDIVEKAEAAKHIWNSDFEDAKSKIKSVFDASHKNVKAEIEKMGLASKMDAEGWRVFNIYVAHDRPKDSLKVIKEHGTNPATNYYKTNFVQPFADLLDRLLALKPYIEKGRKPNPNAVKKPTFKPSSTSEKDMARVKDVYLKLLKKWYPEQVAHVIEYYKSELPNAVEKLNSKQAFAHKVDGVIKSLIMSVKKDGGGHEYAARPDANDRIKVSAEKTVNSLQEMFINKNLQKVSSIVSAKGSLKEVKLGAIRVGSAGKIDGDIIFTFEDGTEFTVKNQTVIVWNSSKVFARFPTTFHKVKMTDGKVHAKQSEEQMNKDFAGIK